MTTALEKTLARTRAAADQRQSAAATEYRKLVQRAGRGEEVDPESLVSFLDAHGYEVSQFQTDALAYSARLDLKLAADAVSAARKQHAEVQAAIARHEATLEAERQKATEKYEAATGPLFAKLKDLAATVTKGEEAANQLLATNSDPEIAARRTAAQAEVSRLTAEVRRLRDVIQRELPHKYQAAQNRLRHHQQRTTNLWPTVDGPEGKPVPHQAYQRWAKERAEDVKAAEAGVALVEQEHAKTKAQLAETEAALAQAQAEVQAAATAALVP